MQPKAGRARSAIIEEGHRTVRLGPIERVSDIEHAGDRLAVLVAQGQGPGGGGVVQHLAVHRDGMVRGLGRLFHRRLGDVGVQGLGLGGLGVRNLRRPYAGAQKGEAQRRRTENALHDQIRP